MSMIIDPVMLPPHPTGRYKPAAPAKGLLGNVMYTAAAAGPSGNSVFVTHTLAPLAPPVKAEIIIEGMTYRAKTAGSSGNSIGISYGPSPMLPATSATATLGGLTYTANDPGPSGNSISITSAQGSAGTAGAATLNRSLAPSGTASFAITERPNYYGDPTSVKLVCSDIGSDMADFSQFPASVSGGDSDFNSVSLLISGDSNGGATNNRAFFDSAYNAPLEALTISGKRVMQGSFSPFSKNSGEWSTFFPSYERASSANTNSFFINGTASTGNIGNDFTFECWFNSGGASTHGVLAGKTRLANDVNDCWYTSVSGATGLFSLSLHHSINQTKSFSSATRVDDGRWHHLAAVKQGTSYSVFVDGTIELTENFATPPNSGTGNRITVGGITFNNGDFGRVQCHLSNLRISNTAIYTTGFAVSESALSATPGTVLLTCADNRIKDSGPNNYAIEIQRGGPTARPFSPFTNTSTALAREAGGSVSFVNDRNDNGYIEAANSAGINIGTESFTTECWFYLTAETYDQWVNDYTRNATIYACYGTSPSAPKNGSDLKITGNSTSTGLGLRFTNYVSGVAYSVDYVGTIKTNCWYHVAVVRNGTLTTIFLNGNPVTSGTLAQQNISHTDSLRIGMSPDSWLRHPFNGFISNFRIVKGSAVYTSAFTPSTTALTAVSGTALLTCKGSQLSDESTYASSMTSSGMISIASFTPFNDYGSVAFDGYSGLTIADNPAFHLTDDFTIEAWINPSNVSSFQAICGHWPGHVNTNCSFLVQINPNARLQLSYGIGSTNLSVAGASTTLTKGVWNHIAVTRSGSTIKFYVNGILDSNAPTVSGQLNNSTGSFTIGFANATDQQYFNGSISNLRIVKGAALYSSAFTPSASKLSAVPGTSLLACQSPMLVDASGNNLSIVPGASIAIRPSNPFASEPDSAKGSGFFSGSSLLSYTAAGNRRLDPGLGDFTLEAWIYPINDGSSSNQVIFSKYGYGQNGYKLTMTNSGNPNRGGGLAFEYLLGWTNATSVSASASILKNNWHHVAVSRSGSTIRLFLDGVLIGSNAVWGSTNISTGNASLLIGGTTDGQTNAASPFIGHIGSIRLSKGNSIYSSDFTPSQSSTNDSPGTTFLMNFSNAAIADASSNFVLETVGSLVPSNASPKFGSASMFFNGTDAGLKLSAVDNDWCDQRLQLGTKDFTLEAWIKPSVSMNGKFIYYVQFSQAEYYVLMSNGKISFQRMGISVVTSTSTIALNEWTHFAISRSAGSTKLYINGVLEASTTTSYNFGVDLSGNALIASIGYRHASASGTYFSGYIDDFRLTVGKDRYPTPTVSRSLLGTTEVISFPTGSTVSQILAVVGSSGTNPSSRVAITSSSSGTLSASNPSPNPGVTTSGGLAGESLSVSISGSDIAIRLAGSGSTSEQVKSALEANASTASALYVSNPVGNASVFSKAYLSGGAAQSPGPVSASVVGSAISILVPPGMSNADLKTYLEGQQSIAGEAGIVDLVNANGLAPTSYGPVNLEGGNDGVLSEVTVIIDGDNVTVSVPEGTLATEVASSLNADQPFAALLSASATNELAAETTGTINLSGGE